MTLTDIIVTVVLVVILGSAIAYIIKSKKKGVKCIGCPEGCNCSHSRKGDSGCGCSGEGCSCHTDENPN